jgi:hypothetical protein
MRGRKPDRPSKRDQPSGTPLDEKRRHLEEEQARVRREVASKERLIKEAPKLKAEAEKRRRDELVTRASRTESRTPGALLDPRHSFEANVGALVRTRKLRREKTQGMWTFFALLLVLAAVLYWIWAVVIQGLNR